jgi:hypothetical protein
LETFTVKSGLQIKKLEMHNDYLLKVQIFKEKMLGKVLEENRIMKQEIDDLKNSKDEGRNKKGYGDYFNSIKISKKRNKSMGDRMNINISPLTIPVNKSSVMKENFNRQMTIQKNIDS